MLSASKKKDVSALEEYYLKPMGRGATNADCEAGCDKDEKCTGYLIASEKNTPEGECLYKYDTATAGQQFIQARDRKK